MDDYEVIVVNDGSQDNTGEVLEELRREFAPRMRVVTHPENRGYGGALRTGFASATKEFVFYTDGDSQYDVAELPRLLELVVARPPDWSTATSWSGTIRPTASGSAPSTTSARGCCSASASATSIATTG